MKLSAKHIIFVISFTAVCWVVVDAFSDDSHYPKRHRYRKGSLKGYEDNGHAGNDHLEPVTDTNYRETCGGCHFAYQPGLLPSSSWVKILGRLDDHFGEQIDADPVTVKNISGYLQLNSAEKSSAKRSVKIMRCLGNQAPLRITDIAYIRNKHHELDSTIFKRPSVGSFSNCIACHTSAEKGIYDDEDVKIPN